MRAKPFWYIFYFFFFWNLRCESLSNISCKNCKRRVTGTDECLRENDDERNNGAVSETEQHRIKAVRKKRDGARSEKRIVILLEKDSAVGNKRSRNGCERARRIRLKNACVGGWRLREMNVYDGTFLSRKKSVHRRQSINTITGAFKYPWNFEKKETR